MADGKGLGVGIIHPATCMDPERLVDELRLRANVVTERFVPAGEPLDEAR